MVADLLHFGPELSLQALALGTTQPSGAAPLCLQLEALLLQLRDPVADLSSPAHVLASMIPRGLLSPAHIYSLPQYVDNPAPTMGVQYDDPGPLGGPGLCSCLDMDFGEFYFHALR